MIYFHTPFGLFCKKDALNCVITVMTATTPPPLLPSPLGTPEKGDTVKSMIAHVAYNLTEKKNINVAADDEFRFERKNTTKWFLKKPGTAGLFRYDFRSINKQVQLWSASPVDLNPDPCGEHSKASVVGSTFEILKDFSQNNINSEPKNLLEGERLKLRAVFSGAKRWRFKHLGGKGIFDFKWNTRGDSIEFVTLDDITECVSSLGEMKYVYTDVNSFMNLSDLLEDNAISENQITSVDMEFPQSVDLSGLSERRLYRNLTDSQRANNSVDAEIIGNYTGEETWCLYDDLETIDFHGFCSIGRPIRTGTGSSDGYQPDGDMVHIQQSDGTIGIKYSIGPKNGLNTCTIDNFTAINGAPWLEAGHTSGPKTYTEGDFGNGYPTTKDKYSLIGNIYLKEHASNHMVGFAHSSCGYEVTNTNFTNVNIKSSSENLSMFAGRLNGPVVMENVNVDGSIRALNSRCWNNGLLYSWASDGTKLTIKNCTFNMQNRGGRFNCGLIGGGMSSASVMTEHLFENVTISGYQSNEVWGTTEYNWGGKGWHGMINSSAFLSQLGGNHTLTMKNVTIDADVSHNRGEWGGAGSYFIGICKGTETAPVVINIDDVKLNGNLLYSFDGGTHGGCFVASTEEVPNNNNPQPKAGLDVYPYDPNSNLTNSQKESFKPPFRGTDRNCSYLGYYLFSTAPENLTMNLKDFYIHGEQIFANEVVASLLCYAGNLYINDAGPYYRTEDQASGFIDETAGGSVKQVSVSSPGSNKTFDYWTPDNPSSAATENKFNINDV